MRKFAKDGLDRVLNKPYISPGEECGAEEASGSFVIACSNSAELLDFVEA